MTDLDSFFKYIVSGGGFVIAYFLKAFHKGIKEHEHKVDDMDRKISKLESQIYLVDSQTSAKIDKLEQLSKLQFDQLHMEIGELKTAMKSINDNIQEVLKR